MNCLAKFCVSLALLGMADGLASAFASQPDSASSTPRHKAEPSYRQRVWTRENGLPDNRILSLLQTQDGHLWVGTPRGLARFDGLTFEVINGETVAEFVSEECAALAEDADSTLWIGTPAGLIHLVPDRIERFTTANGLASDRILSLCRARNGDLWIGTASGLTRRRAGVFETVLPVSAETIADPQALVVRAMYEDAAGSVWLGGMSSVRRWDPATDRFSPVPMPEGHQQLAMQIAGDARTNVWLRGIGLFLCSPDRTITVTLDRQQVSRYYEPLQAFENVRALLVDREGNPWLGWEQSGLTRLSGGQKFEFGPEDGLSDGIINCLLEDREGNLWIGTDRGGLNCWQPRRFAAYGSADGLPSDDVRVVYPARDGGVWVGTERGVALWRDGLVIRRPIGPSLYDRRIRAIHEEPDRALWIGTMDSLERWHEGERVAYRWSERPDSNRIRAISADRTGTLWVGHTQGLARWSEGQFTHFSTADGLPHNDVRAILEDRGGRLWLGTFGGGLCSIDRTPQLRVQSLLCVSEGLSDNHICIIYEDSRGVLWAGTLKGLNRIEFASATPQTTNTSPTIAVFNRTNGLPDDVVNAIVEDDLGHLWIGCDRGICRVALDQFDAVASGRAPRVQCVVYDESDSLPSSEVKGQNSHPAACKTEDGRLWFATTKGAVVFDPARVIQEDLAPLVQIDR
ncbi:MAG TPA: two-component regulator propeller domain-containing protein, partial [Verrucomicrobiota bacterium]|nr:two-component regulator propeller domain-containing protein [Verrucomicrobiota bacterium]